MGVTQPLADERRCFAVADGFVSAALAAEPETAPSCAHPNSISSSGQLASRTMSSESPASMYAQTRGRLSASGAKPA